MTPAEPLHMAAPLLRSTIEAKELEYIAFSGNHEVTHGILRSVPADERVRYGNRYILSAAIAGGIAKLRKFLAASAEAAAADEKAFIDELLRLFVATSRNTGISTRELFLSILQWSDELSRLSLLREALLFYDEALDVGIAKYPDLYVRALLGKARVLSTRGSLREAREILLSLATRPYIIPDRSLVPDLLFNLGRELLLHGDIMAYKEILFRGLRPFTSRVENREPLIHQIARTYRRSARVLIDRRLSMTDRLLFTLHRLYFAVRGHPAMVALGMAALMRIALLGTLYALNYWFVKSPRLTPDSGRLPAPGDRKTDHAPSGILVTRAMGGIGDLLMMTPGLCALKKSRPRETIHLAIPKRYFPVFEGNPDVQLLEIEKDGVDTARYKRWYNFTDCPAARVESLTSPRVRRGRIEIFARALGVSSFRVRRMDKRPRYFVLPEERIFQLEFWTAHGLDGRKVVGVQLRSDEVYRDYPHMRQLVSRIARDYRVLVFDAEKIDGCGGENVTKVEGLRMRQAFALASACDAIVAPDSAFVHLAGAFDIPCVALYGPIDGAVRTSHYPKCRPLDVKASLGCLPCWRNDEIPCTLTNMRSSVCMADISQDTILTTLREIL